MKKLLLSRLTIGILALASAPTFAQDFSTMPIASGFNADVIANGIGSASNSTTHDIDNVNFALVSRDFLLTPTSSPLNFGLPIDGKIISAVASTPGLSYQLADYSSNNSLRLTTTGDNGTLIFSTPKPAVILYLLATSGNGSSTVKATVTFADNTIQQSTQLNVPDWYGGSYFAIKSLGRINRANNNLEPNNNDPRLYQTALNINPENQNKSITSITFEKTSGSGTPNIFAVSMDQYSSCRPPILQPVSDITSSTSKISWSQQANTDSINYDIYYSTTPTQPDANTNPIIKNITNSNYTLTGLSSATTYYYWVKSNCDTNTSFWSFTGTFHTLCGSITPPYATSLANGIENCWNNALAGGTPATGPTETTIYWSSRNFLNSHSNPNSLAINLYSNNRTGWLKTVPFNLSSGENKVQFDYGITTYSGTGASNMGSDDAVHFLISTDNGQTWIILNTWNKDFPASNTSTTYTYDLVSYRSDNAIFSFYGTSGIVSDNEDYHFYVANFKIEPTAPLASNEASTKKAKMIMHPNPFKESFTLVDYSNVQSLSIMDASGKIVKTINHPPQYIDSSYLNAGFYILNIAHKDGTTSSTKIIKK